jgi:hypothetical protein
MVPEVHAYSQAEHNVRYGQFFRTKSAREHNSRQEWKRRGARNTWRAARGVSAGDASLTLEAVQAFGLRMCVAMCCGLTRPRDSRLLLMKNT